MKTRLSSKGQVVLPSAIRRRLGLLPGDEMSAVIQAHRIILTPSRRPASRARARIAKHPLTGLPVMRAPSAPVVDSEQVARALAEFP